MIEFFFMIAQFVFIFAGLFLVSSGMVFILEQMKIKKEAKEKQKRIDAQKHKSIDFYA